MKNLMRLGMMALLVATFSCNETKKTEKSLDKDLAITDMNSAETTADLPCLSSQLINGSTYYFWSQGWLAAEKKLNRSYTSNQSPRIKFPRKWLNSFRKADPADSEGVMIYYGMASNSQNVPFLILVKTKGCTPVLTASDPSNSTAIVGVIAYDYNPTIHTALDTDGFISTPISISGTNNKYQYAPIPLSKINTITDSTGYIAKWMNFQSVRTGNYSHVPIKGYNYSWSRIDDIINDSSNPQDLTVAFGIRTIGSDEVSEFYSDGSPTNDDGSLRAGLPVLVNMLLDEIPNSDTDTDTDTVQYEDFDFAKPCPTYCD